MIARIFQWTSTCKNEPLKSKDWNLTFQDADEVVHPGIRPYRCADDPKSVLRTSLDFPNNWALIRWMAGDFWTVFIISYGFFLGVWFWNFTLEALE